jgi:ribonuclease J
MPSSGPFGHGYDRRLHVTAARTTLSFLHTGNPTGLKFLVEHGGARCLFDFGREHAPGRALFSLGLRPRPDRELADLVAAGEAPPLEGVYAAGGWDGRTHVFISHMHLDHTALVGYLAPELPLFYPEAMEPVRAGADSSGYFRWRRPVGSAVPDRSEVTVGEVKVRFIAVDHDVPGSTGFLVTTPEVTLAFTGDCRRHGLHPELTAAFATEVRGVDVLIQECVSLGYLPPDPLAVVLDEAGVVAELARAAAETPGLLIANCYGMNRERVAGLAEGCAVAGRKLLLEPQTAAMAGWPGVLGDLEEVRSDPRGHCLQLGFESLPMLIDLQPPAGSVWIQCGGPPFGGLDPASIVLEAWCARFGLELRAVNTSGHSRPGDVVRTVREVKPRVVLPVHSRAPEALVMPDVRSFLPQAGVTYLVADLLSPASTPLPRRGTRRRSGRS